MTLFLRGSKYIQLYNIIKNELWISYLSRNLSSKCCWIRSRVQLLRIPDGSRIQILSIPYRILIIRKACILNRRCPKPKLLCRKGNITRLSNGTSVHYCEGKQ